MDEQRKYTILFAATILAARKLNDPESKPWGIECAISDLIGRPNASCKRLMSVGLAGGRIERASRSAGEDLQVASVSPVRGPCNGLTEAQTDAIAAVRAFLAIFDFAAQGDPISYGRHVH